MMTNLAVIAALAVTITGCASWSNSTTAQREQTSRSVLSTHHGSADWLDGQGTLTEKHLQRLMHLANRDPVAAPILLEAQKVLGSQSTRELMNYVTVCGDNDSEGVHGLATMNSSIRHLSRSMSELTGERPARSTASVVVSLPRTEQVMRVVEGEDYVSVFTRERGSICLSREQDVFQAFSTFVHELTHLARYAGRSDPDDRPEAFLSKYANARDFALKLLQKPGGELEAHSNGYGALVRATGSRGRLPEAIRDAFDDRGNLKDRKRLIDYVLNEKDYGTDFEQTYRDRLVDHHNSLVERQEFLYSLHESRSQYTSSRFAPPVQRIARESAKRLAAEIEQIRRLQVDYRARLASEEAMAA